MSSTHDMLFSVSKIIAFVSSIMTLLPGDVILSGTPSGSGLLNPGDVVEVESQVRDGVISFGVSSYGYDIRVADEYKIFTNVHSTIVDPKNFDPKSMVDFKGDVCIIPPNSFVLS